MMTHYDLRRKDSYVARNYLVDYFLTGCKFVIEREEERYSVTSSLRKSLQRVDF